MGRSTLESNNNNTLLGSIRLDAELIVWALRQW